MATHQDGTMCQRENISVMIALNTSIEGNRAFTIITVIC